MPALLEPFTGYVPTQEFAHRVVGPPRSMLSKDQLEAAKNDSFSFRYSVGRRVHPSRAEAEEWLEECRSQGALSPVGPAVIVYRQIGGDYAASGVLGELPVDAYSSGAVKQHERTFAKTVQKMADYIATTRILGNPVLLAHRPRPAVSRVIAAQVRRDADLWFTTVEGVSHQMWFIEGEEAKDLCREFDDSLYIMDGHHRLAAASLMARREGRTEARVPVGLFSADELALRTFARCVTDPELDQPAVLERLQSAHRLEEVDEIEARPRVRHEVGVKLGSDFFRLQIDPDNIPDDYYAALDVNLLQDLILGPVFGVKHPAKDKRVSFVADLSDVAHLRFDADAWLLPFPAAPNDVMTVADSGRVMPHKSTWFAPKLPSGLVIRLVGGG